MIKQKVLIVDDKPPFGADSFNLEQSGFDTEVASDGLAALEMFESYKPDLGVLDLMPGKNLCMQRDQAHQQCTYINTAKETELGRWVGAGHMAS